VNDSKCAHRKRGRYSEESMENGCRHPVTLDYTSTNLDSWSGAMRIVIVL
tara:strand:- start:6002 stop:6151 length:150 start_codon:yes stop_codon:yes gene_type:complete